jgi:hypothetical protein
MALKNDSQPTIRKAMDEKDCPPSKLQLQLAASIIDQIIEKNAGREAADEFWGDDSFDVLNDFDTGPEFDDPGEETVPEMALIMHNISPC